MIFRARAIVGWAKGAFWFARTHPKPREGEEPKYQQRERSTLEAQLDRAAHELRQRHEQWVLKAHQRERQRQEELAARHEQARKDWELGYNDGFAGRPFDCLKAVEDSRFSSTVGDMTEARESGGSLSDSERSATGLNNPQRRATPSREARMPASRCGAG
jgi:hypothetical protein